MYRLRLSEVLAQADEEYLRWATVGGTIPKGRGLLKWCESHSTSFTQMNAPAGWHERLWPVWTDRKRDGKTHRDIIDEDSVQQCTRYPPYFTVVASLESGLPGFAARFGPIARCARVTRWHRCTA